MINNLSQSTKEKDIKSMDGKIINESLRSKPTTKKGFTYYCNEYLFLRLWDGYNPKILEKKPMDPKLINQLNLSDSIITAYALNPQKKQ